MTLRKHPRLIDVVPGWASDEGLFTELQNYDVPWKTALINEHDLLYPLLDFEYFGNISGEKKVSPLVSKYLRIQETETLSQSQLNLLAGLLFGMFGTQWAKEWETLDFEYNPIENYSMVESMEGGSSTTYGKTHVRTDDLTHTKTGTETQTPDLTDETTPDLETTSDNSVYGFNSSAKVPVGENLQTSTGTNTITRTGTDELEYDTTDRDTGTQRDVDSGTDSTENSHELTRRGNIGVTTSQQMIASERELWMWNYFYTVVFPAIDRVMTIQIY